MNLSQREDVKFKISKLKDWKRMSKFLKETKEELLDKRKGISYSPEMPGYHSTIFQEYNKLLEKTEDYDKCIEVYDTDRKSTRLNSSHWNKSRMPSSA